MLVDRPKIFTFIWFQIKEVEDRQQQQQSCTRFLHCTSLIKKDQNPHQNPIDQKAFQILFYSWGKKRDHQIRKHDLYDTHTFKISYRIWSGKNYWTQPGLGQGGQGSTEVQLVWLRLERDSTVTYCDSITTWESLRNFWLYGLRVWGTESLRSLWNNTWSIGVALATPLTHSLY